LATAYAKKSRSSVVVAQFGAKRAAGGFEEAGVKPYYEAEDDCWYDAKGLQWTQIGPAPTLDPNHVYDTGPHFVEFSGGAVAWVTEHGIYGNDEAVRQFGEAVRQFGISAATGNE